MSRGPTVHLIALMARECLSSGLCFITQEWQLLKFWILVDEKLISVNHFRESIRFWWHKGDRKYRVERNRTFNTGSDYILKLWTLSIVSLLMELKTFGSTQDWVSWCSEVDLLHFTSPNLLFHVCLGGVHTLLASTHRLWWSLCTHGSGRGLWHSLSQSMHSMPLSAVIGSGLWTRLKSVQSGPISRSSELRFGLWFCRSEGCVGQEGFPGSRVGV